MDLLNSETKPKSSWKERKKWSDQFLPEIKTILGQTLIAEAPIEEDALRNTDLMVLNLNSIRIGCRVRRVDYLLKYGREFTIRSGRPNGNETELSKILDGWGDYFFYGFGGEDKKLKKWFVGDLSVFREWFVPNIWTAPAEEIRNLDLSSDFMSFRIADMPKEFFVNSSWGGLCHI